MARAMAAAMVGCIWGALLGATPARAESCSGASQHLLHCLPASSELTTGPCKLDDWAAALETLRAVAREERSDLEWLCLARAQTHFGLWIDALDSYDELAERSIAKPAERALQQRGARERRELEQRLAWIQVVPSAPLGADTCVTLDGEPIVQARLGVEFPVQPGRRTLALESPQGTTRLPALELAEGEHRVVALVMPLAPAVASAAPETAARRASSTSASAANEPSLVWTRRALYVGAIATTGGLISMISGKQSLQAFGIGSAVVGGLSFLTAALLPLVTASSEEDSHRENTARRIEPWIGMTSAGVSGSF